MMLREVRRVLKPGASLHLLDFGSPASGADRAPGRCLSSSPLLLDNAEDRILGLMRQAGFEEPKRTGGGSMLFGLALYACYQASGPRHALGSALYC